jgi:O-antigen ligase
MDIILNYLFIILRLFSDDGTQILLAVYFILMYKYWHLFIKEKILLVTLIFLLYGTVLSLFCDNKNYAFSDILKYIYGWCFPFFLGYTFRSKYDTHKLILATVYIFATLIFIGFFSYMGYIPEKPLGVRFCHDNILTVCTWQRVHFAAQTAFMFVVSLTMLLFLENINKFLKVILVLVSFVFVLGILLSGSRIYYGAITVILFIITVFYCYKSKNFKKILPFLLCSLLLAIVVCSNNETIKNRIKKISVTKDVSIVYRINMYKYAISVFKQYPLFGAGPRQAMLKNEYNKVITDIDKNGHLHSAYLDILANFGLTGLIIFLILILYILKELIYTYKTTNSVLALAVFFAWICILIGDIFDMTIKVPFVSSLYFWFTGLALRMKVKIDNKN